MLPVKRLELDFQHGLGSAHVTVSPLLFLWAEEKVFHLKSPNLSRSTVGKVGGTGV